MESGKALDTACFHAQQAAEKYLKAFLCFNGIDFPKTHDIEELLGLCATRDKRFSDLVEETVFLTDFAVELTHFLTNDAIATDSPNYICNSRFTEISEKFCDACSQEIFPASFSNSRSLCQYEKSLAFPELLLGFYALVEVNPRIMSHFFAVFHGSSFAFETPSSSDADAVICNQS